MLHLFGWFIWSCIYSLELLMMSGMPLETCWAFNKLWNNTFYYKAASFWYFYWVILRCTNPRISDLLTREIAIPRTKKSYSCFQQIYKAIHFSKYFRSNTYQFITSLYNSQQYSFLYVFCRHSFLYDRKHFSFPFHLNLLITVRSTFTPFK